MILDLGWLGSFTSATTVVHHQEKYLRTPLRNQFDSMGLFSHHDAKVSNLHFTEIHFLRRALLEPDVSNKLAPGTDRRISLTDTTDSFGTPAFYYGEAQEDDELRMSISALDDYSVEKREVCYVHFVLHVPWLFLASFDFLLKPPHAQQWDLLLQYLYLAEYTLQLEQERDMDVAEVLGFLSMLSTLDSAESDFWLSRNLILRCQKYSTVSRDMTRTETILLNELSDYGVIWQQEVRNEVPSSVSLTIQSQLSSCHFYPTHVATAPSPPLPISTGTKSSPKENFILTEANCNVYAYTGTSCTALARRRLTIPICSR
ncbi:hypothetical protein DFH09DRAFT_1477822 [Mycena vulgaris]|nr:hypothetical protein DFH09DRAFT_1477822 [Mycena vulgaris]